MAAVVSEVQRGCLVEIQKEFWCVGGAAGASPRALWSGEGDGDAGDEAVASSVLRSGTGTDAGPTASPGQISSPVTARGDTGATSDS